jgi:hypothetical protein
MLVGSERAERVGEVRVVACCCSKGINRVGDLAIYAMS